MRVLDLLPTDANSRIASIVKPTTPQNRPWIVTGGAGFIGRQIVAEAKAKGLSVRPVDRVPADGPHVILDLLNPDFREWVRRSSPAIIVHAAGPASVRDSLTDPEGDFRNSVLPWLSVLEAARSVPLPPKVVLISSAAVYGSPERLPIRETDALAPLSPYGYHKLVCEQLAEEYAKVYGLACLVLRVFSLYGPNQRRLLVWELFRQTTASGAEVRLLGTGEETRDYIHVADMASALAYLAELSWDGCRVLNLASGSSISTRQLAERVAAAVGIRKPIVVSASTPTGDPPHWQADVSELHGLGAPQPRPLDEGLHSCVQAWLADR
jgi:UDP-glucose 4-epimerase